MKINKKELISIIQNTEAFIKPKIELEQYCIDATSAVDLIFFAGFEYNDISNRFIIDLGSGTGRLSIASAYLNAYAVLSVDIDNSALQSLKRNIEGLGLENIIFPLCSNVKNLELRKENYINTLKITTIMNPPFGVKKRKADRIFLEKAFTFSDTIYSIHLAGEKVFNFISKFCEKFKWHIDNYFPYKLILERSFEFHTKRAKKIDVNVFRFVKNKGKKKIQI
ncbi:MAG: METTL5 family protein [Promethearchaeota archaeon]|jgi:putative methylase